MPKSTINVAHWDDVVFKVRHQVAYCDIDTFRAYASKKLQIDTVIFDPMIAAATFSTAISGQDFTVTYWLNAKHSQSLSDHVRVHEVVHGVDRVFQYKGVKPGAGSTEVRAYYTDTIFNVVGHLLKTLKIENAKDKAKAAAAAKPAKRRGKKNAKDSV